MANLPHNPAPGSQEPPSGENSRLLSFARQVNRPQQPTPRGWPPSVTHRIPIPAEVKGEAPLIELTRGRPKDESALAHLTSGTEPPADKVTVTLRPRPGSSITLRFPRLGVETTTPASEPRAITGGREQRVIDVSDPDAYDAGTVTVDVLATSLREPTVAAIVSFRHTAWLWLLPLALLGVAWAAARRRLDLRLDSLKFSEPAGAPPRTAKKQRAGRRKKRRG